MGKYSSLKGKIPTFEPEPSYQEKVNEEKKRLVGDAENPEDASLSWLKGMFVQMKQKKKALEDEIKEYNLTLAALDQMLVHTMDENGQQNVKFDDGITLYIKDEPVPQITNRDLFNEWIRETGQEALFSVNAKTAQGLVKNLLIEGKDIPPGTEVSMLTKVAILGMKGLDD